MSRKPLTPKQSDDRALVVILSLWGLVFVGCVLAGLLSSI